MIFFKRRVQLKWEGIGLVHEQFKQFKLTFFINIRFIWNKVWKSLKVSQCCVLLFVFEILINVSFKG